MFDTELFRIGNVLVLTAAAIAKITAWRQNPLGGRFQNLDQLCPGKTGFDLRQFRFHFFAMRDEWNKDDKVAQPPHPFAAESDVVNDESDFLARSGKRLVHGILSHGRQPALLAFGKNMPHLGRSVGGGQTIFLAQVIHGRGVLDELVRPADAHHRRADAFFIH